MRLFTITLAAIACTFGLALAGCAPSEAASGVRSGVTTSNETEGTPAKADCAGCEDKSKCADKADCADCTNCTDEQKAKCKKAKQGTDSVYPADSAPAKGVPAGSSSAPSKGAGGS